MKNTALPILAAVGAALAAVAMTTTVAVANEAGILKCRAMADANKRLACYDAIDLGISAANVKLPAGAAVAAAGVAAGAAATAAVTGAATTAAGAAASRQPAGSAAEFGLPPKQTAVGVDRIETNIKGRLDSWQQGSRIRLANGQLWQVTDDSRGVCECDNRKVVITRGAFGTYFLEIEGKGNAPRVKRIE